MADKTVDAEQQYTNASSEINDEMNVRMPVTFRHLLFNSTASEEKCDYYGQVEEDVIIECTESPGDGNDLKDYDEPEGFRRPDRVNEEEEEDDEGKKEEVSGIFDH